MHKVIPRIALMIAPSRQIGGLPVAILLLLTVSLLRAGSAESPKDKPPKPPLGLPAVQWPADNLYSVEKAELGRLLFFDTRLSSATISCASCHEPQKGFT